jgi:hypothetical protein
LRGLGERPLENHEQQGPTGRDPRDFPALVPLSSQKLGERENRALRLLIDPQHGLRRRFHNRFECEVFLLTFWLCQNSPQQEARSYRSLLNVLIYAAAKEVRRIRVRAV